MAYNPYAGVTHDYATANSTYGAAPTGGGAYGGIPNLPNYTTDTNQTIGTNAYPQLAAILGSGYQGGLNQEMTNIGSLLQGQIPSDVMANLGVAGAERGIATGSYGSPNANAAMMRALGLTSLGLEQQGITDLSQVIGQVPIQQNQTGTQTTDLSAARAQYDAAPNPTLAAQQALQNAQQGIQAGAGGVRMPTAAGSNTGMPAAWQGQIPAGGSNSYVDDAWYRSQAGQTGGTVGTGLPGIGQNYMDESWYSDPYNWAQFGTGSDAGSTYDEAWYSDPYNWAQFGTGGGLGYQDTSGGTMYMGDWSGYGGGGYNYLTTDNDPVDYGSGSGGYYDEYSWLFEGDE